jgi:Zn-dependent protease/CBS domain-containing protein
MRSGLRLGRLFGISIHIDWSWLLIFFLITWNLATSFAQIHPAWGPALSWSVAIIAALLFFASVLAHELAHALVAKAQHIPVRNITLFLFGGVSNIEQEPPSPGAEFVLAIVGPITSIVLGILFLLAAGLGLGAMGDVATNPAALASRLDPLTTLLLWLGPVNLILGIFNLVPGFPLDGGRVLRSILWAATKNLRTATRWVSWIGQAIAWLMIFGGIAMIFGTRLPFFGTGVVGGVWLAIIGWFLSNAAIQSYQRLLIHDMLEGVPVTRLMRTNVPAVAPTMSISTLVDNYILHSDERAFPVLEGDRPVGLVTLDDVRKVAREAWDTTTVGEIMTPAEQLAVVTPQQDAAEVLDKLIARDVRQVPVMLDGHVIGMVRRRDIVRWLQLQSGAVAG